MELQHLTENVLVAPGDLRRVRPWIGIVRTAAGCVLIDSGNGPDHGRKIHAALEQMGAPPVTHILLTHHHWDHVFGSCAFPGATVIAHELTQRHLQVMAQEPWSASYLEQKAGDDPTHRLIATMMAQAVPDWAEFVVVPAHGTFADIHRLELGGVQFVLEHVGGQHEPDQCVVHVRPDNVLFLGDATYGRGPRQRWNLEALAAELEGFVAWDPRYYVEGHRRPATLQVFLARIAQMRNLASRE